MRNDSHMVPTAAWLLAGASLCGAAAFPAAFQSALTNQPPAAEAALVRLAEEQDASAPYGLVRKDRALFKAAEFAGQQDRFDQASALADRIQDAPLRTLARMELLARQKEYAAVLEATAAANIGEWPDALIYRAAMCRAEAAMAQGEAKKAEQDLILAARYVLNPHHKARARFLLAGLYRESLEDDAKAMEVYDDMLAWAPMNWMYYQAVIEYARLAIRHDQGQEALKRLDTIDTNLSGPNPRFPAMVLECHGDIHAAMGNIDEARAHYRKVAAAATVPGDIVKSVQTKLEALDKQ